MPGWIGCLSRKLLLCYKIKVCLAAASAVSRILLFPIHYKMEEKPVENIPDIPEFLGPSSLSLILFFPTLKGHIGRQQPHWDGNKRKPKDSNNKNKTKQKRHHLVSAFHKQAVCQMRGRDFGGLEFLDLDQTESPGPSQPKWLSPVVQATWWGCKWEK